MKFLIRLLIVFYQRIISPPLHWIGGPNSGCRYDPTCSQYFLEAVETHGAIKGSWMGFRRISRCHPWGGFGFDPVPGSARDLAARELAEADSESGQIPESQDPGHSTKENFKTKQKDT